MPSYRAPVDDTLFLLQDVLDIQKYGNLDGFADVSPDVLAQILGEAGKLCEEMLAPLNQSGDANGCRRNPDGSVTAPAGFKAAFRAYAEGGWIGLSVPADFGGQGLPYTLSMPMNEFASSANMAFAMYPGLTQGALAALLTHGSDEQKRLYRSEERRVGKECRRLCRSRWSPYH
jgi:alkylation response protein AidB-like acyl-CoA dehydrogenase